MSFALLVLAVLILVPLALHLRGGSIVALSVSAAILYAGAWFAITYDNGTMLIPRTTGDAPLPSCDPAPCQSPFETSANFALFGSIIGGFALIALVFWALGRMNAPLPQDRLKTLFWLLHASLLAIPFVLLIFSSAGMFDGYDGDPAGMPVFAMSSAIVSILCLVALAGFLFTALGALIKRMRA